MVGDYSRLCRSPLWGQRRVAGLAERGVFEPPKGLTPCRFSRPVHSTALPPLLKSFRAGQLFCFADLRCITPPIPGLRPSGQRRRTPLFEIAPGDFVNRSAISPKCRFEQKIDELMGVGGRFGGAQGWAE